MQNKSPESGTAVAENRHAEDQLSPFENLHYFQMFSIFLFGYLLSLVAKYVVGFLVPKIHDFYIDQTLVFFGTFLSDLGTFFGVAVVLAVCSEYLATKTLIKKAAEQFAQEVRNNVFSPELGFRSAGLRAIHQSMPFLQLFDQLQAGDDLIWLDTFAPMHWEWEEHALAAVSRGANLFFLIINPESGLCGLRAAEIEDGFNEKRFKMGLSNFVAGIEGIQSRSQSYSGRVYFEFYSDLLACPVYLVRRRGTPYLAYSSSYLRKATGGVFPHFEWENSSERAFIHDLLKYLVWKWNSNRTDHGQSTKASPILLEK